MFSISVYFISDQYNRLYLGHIIIPHHSNIQIIKMLKFHRYTTKMLYIYHKKNPQNHKHISHTDFLVDLVSLERWSYDYFNEMTFRNSWKYMGMSVWTEWPRRGKSPESITLYLNLSRDVAKSWSTLIVSRINYIRTTNVRWSEMLFRVYICRLIWNILRIFLRYMHYVCQRTL